jgi:hyperosmotically inducible protein
MKNGLMEKKYQKTLLMGIAAWLMITGFLAATETDARIEATAKQSYVFKTYLKGDDIRILSQDGVVTLTGTVASEPHAILAAETVADLPGVKSVDNKLEVIGGIPEKNSDIWIQMTIKNMLMLHGNLNIDNPQVDVKDGLVTLHGEVDSQAEKALTAEYVKDIDGVKDVDNKMTLATAPKSERKTIKEFIDDASIKSQIKLALLLHRGTNAFRASISVNRGVVTVSGMAKNAAEKELVSKRIEDIHGVVSIDNRMTIE